MTKIRPGDAQTIEDTERPFQVPPSPLEQGPPPPEVQGVPSRGLAVSVVRLD
jgi:hypothetical protein